LSIKGQQEAPKHTNAKVGLHRSENQVELNHLQRNCDRPIDVAVQDRRRANLDPEIDPSNITQNFKVLQICNQAN